jgi:hypothetical protein
VTAYADEKSFKVSHWLPKAESPSYTTADDERWLSAVPNLNPKRIDDEPRFTR